MTETKHIVFQDGGYTVPSWVSWVARNADGSIVGYQWQPFELRNGPRLHGYYNEVGQSCVLWSPECEPVLERV